jgi:cytochrome c5
MARILLLTSAAAAIAMAGLMAEAATSKPQDSKVAQSSTESSEPDPGQKKFEANCSRCHDAPESFSPRITGTIVRHMRVRASLSAQDEKDILRFLAP